MRNTHVMSTNVAKPVRVAIIGATGTYGKGILARAEEIGVEAVVITRSPHKFKNVKPTTTVIEVQLDEEDKLKEAFSGCNGITWILTRPVRPTKTPFVGAYAHKDKRGPMNCSIFDQGDFCLYCVASSQWDMLAPHVSSGPQPKEK